MLLTLPNLEKKSLHGAEKEEEMMMRDHAGEGGGDEESSLFFSLFCDWIVECVVISTGAFEGIYN